MPPFSFMTMKKLSKRVPVLICSRQEHPLDVSRITDKIYLGTNLCCQVHYQRNLLKKNIRHEISLEGERVDSPFGVETYLWLPVPDHTAPPQRILQIGVNHMDAVFARGGKVFVHCENGHGRSPTLVAAWFITQGKSVEAALAAVKKGRPEIHPERSQVNALRRFAAATSRRRRP